VCIAFILIVSLPRIDEELLLLLLPAEMGVTEVLVPAWLLLLILIVWPTSTGGRGGGRGGRGGGGATCTVSLELELVYNSVSSTYLCSILS
jgi:hypothetical protein